MSKELTGKNGKTVGTQEYLDALNKNSGMDVWMKSGDTYADGADALCKRIKATFEELHTDLHRNDDSLSLIPESDRKATVEMAEQLKAIGATFNNRAQDADACIKLLELRGGCPKPCARQEKQVLDKVTAILKGQGSGASQSERIKMVEQLVKDGGRYKPGKGDKKDQFLAKLAEGKNQDKQFWQEVLRQVQFENKPAAVKGKNGEVLCSKAYISRIEEKAFGGKFISGGNNTYMQQIYDLFRGIMGIIKTDVTAGIGTDDYMIYDNRVRLKDAVKVLGKYVTAPSNFDADVEKLRRLEHFDNKVIVLTKNTSLPVSAELSWVKGQNILNIYANICFITVYGQTDTAARKKAALDGFKEWEGSYKVFCDQPVEVKVHLNVKQTDTEIATWGGRMMGLEKGYTNVALITKASREAMIAALARAPIGGATPWGLKEYLNAGEGLANNILFQRSFAFRQKDMNSKNIMAIQDPSWKENEMMREVWEQLPDHFYPDEVNLMGLGYTLPNDADHGVSVAKHEFGHILGLGDMYEDHKNFWFLNMKGVLPKHFSDVTKDYIYNNDRWDAVMDTNGKIHNNDIEMVIEAFYTGKRQNFQEQDLFGGAISTVLNKGN